MRREKVDDSVGSWVYSKSMLKCEKEEEELN
jgi:hypothetical protein